MRSGGTGQRNKRPARRSQYLFVVGACTLTMRGGSSARHRHRSARDFERLTEDRRANDLAITLAPGASTPPGCNRAVRGQVGTGRDALIEFGSAEELRPVAAHFAGPQLRGHLLAGGGGDRHFLAPFGAVANFSAQVLARRKLSSVCWCTS
jgi:hypothetical protein